MLGRRAFSKGITVFSDLLGRLIEGLSLVEVAASQIVEHIALQGLIDTALIRLGRRALRSTSVDQAALSVELLLLTVSVILAGFIVAPGSSKFT